jgi:hypothetical protein
MYDFRWIVLSLYLLSFCNKVNYSIRLSIIHSRINKFVIDGNIYMIIWYAITEMRIYLYICCSRIWVYICCWVQECFTNRIIFYKPSFIWNFILLKNIYLIVVIWIIGSNMNVCLVLMTLSNYYSHHLTSIHNELLIQRVTIIYS